MADAEYPALKDWFDAARFRHMAQEITALEPAFDTAAFLETSLPGLDDLTLMQRMRRMTVSLHATLPGSYRDRLALLRRLAPRINHSFVTLVLPDYVGLYGGDDFQASMDALAFFTPFGSSEFAVREFLRRDLQRTLTVMEKWSRHENEAVRRLACEGCRPRLPWSFRLEALIADPAPVATILENLKTDPALYVRKSVANHLNDITRDHPAWVMDRVSGWSPENPHTAWIIKRALRTLIKQGDPRALGLIGAGGPPQAVVENLSITPRTVVLGQQITVTFQLRSLSAKSQRLVVDYAVHYVKKAGGTSAKVFKLKELTLPAGATVTLSRRQSIRDFTTRTHYPGRHGVDILVNGRRLAQDFFTLTPAG